MTPCTGIHCRRSLPPHARPSICALHGSHDQERTPECSTIRIPLSCVAFIHLPLKLVVRADFKARLAQDARGENQGNCELDEGDHELS
jgi:hypothetical protein